MQHGQSIVSRDLDEMLARVTFFLTPGLLAWKLLYFSVVMALKEH